LHTFVAQHAVEQGEQPLAVLRVTQQQRQRRHRLFRLIARNDLLLAADAPRLVCAT
jgi:hypothetical protein